MPYFIIQTINSAFASRDEGADYESPEAALALGVTAATAIASEEIDAGASTSAVEIIVERQDGSQVLRSVLAISLSAMMIVGEPIDAPS